MLVKVEEEDIVLILKLYESWQEADLNKEHTDKFMSAQTFEDIHDLGLRYKAYVQA